MKKKYSKLILILALLIGAIHSISSQISITGDAYYQLDVVGYMGRARGGCGGIDGLKEVTVQNSTSHTLFNDRLIYDTFEYNYQYTKNDPVTNVEVRKVIKWKNGVGDCTAGPRNRVNTFNNITTCYQNYMEDAHDGLHELTVTSSPIVNLDIPEGGLFIGNKGLLEIQLPDNLSNSHYNWKYKVGNGSDQFIPSGFNGNSTLEIHGEDFLNETDYGKTVSVWLEMNCSAGVELAKGIARKDAYQLAVNECNTLPLFERIRCIATISRRVEEYFNNLYTDELIATYQSKVSNPLIFTYLRMAPFIYDTEATDPSCNTSIDGQVKVIFESNLSQGEMFGTISLIKNNAPITAVNVTTLDPEPNGRWSYTFTDNVPPGTYNVELIGSYNGIPTYTDSPNHTDGFTVEKPTPIEFEITNVVNVYCNDGDNDPANNNDGEIHLSASGGNNGAFEYSILGENLEGDWLPFSNGTTHIINNLRPGDYDIKVRKTVRDGIYCIAKEEIGSDNVLIERRTITQPNAPLQIELVDSKEPTAYSFYDGYLKVLISEGTRYNDNTYDFEWQDENGLVLTSLQTEYVTNQGYFVTLRDLPKGTFNITVRDKNYTTATYKTGCFISNEAYTLNQPDPLEVEIEITHSISCNNGNDFSNNVDTNVDAVPDQFQDGILTAHAKGGVQYDTNNPDFSEPFPENSRGDRFPYYYNWKIQNSNGVWEDLSRNDSIIDFLSTATYSLNITDKNGIVLGTYEAQTDADGFLYYELIEAIDSTKYVPQPEKLRVNFDKTIVSCANGDDGTATVYVQGGTPPYSYQWSTGETTTIATNLIKGTHLVFITDAKGCQIEGRVVIEQPEGLEITATTLIPPTCYNGNDGQIEVQVSGGTPPYTYKWTNGNTTTHIQNLSFGTYRIEVIDKKGCKTFFEEILENPAPVVVNMDEKRALCGDQSLDLDITINDPDATYSWIASNGFSSSDATVTLTEAGTYIATITTSLGCVGMGEIVVAVFDLPIDAEYFLSTQAYTGEEVILVNVSTPVGDQVVWTVPDDAEIVAESDDNLIVRFEYEGAYEINLRSYQGDCYEDYSSIVIVEKALESPEVYASQNEFIEEFLVYPNPNNGAFKVKITLAEESNVSLKIISMASAQGINERIEKGSNEYLLDYNLKISSGMYLLLLETPKGSETRKLVID